MAKGPDAFRTISEVAEWLEVPTHVLRFWESRFTQVKPVKRAGGRRYYRPADMQLLGGIKRLLHDEGLTIRGVQKLLREEGVRHVAALSPPVEGEAWEQTSAKVISLNPLRRGATDNRPPDRWPFTDEGTEDDATPVAGDVTPSPATVTSDPLVVDSSSGATEGADATPEAEATDEAGQAETHAAGSDVPPEHATPTFPQATPTLSPPPDVATEPSHVDESSVLPPPLLIAPLAAMGRAARARKARVMSSAIVEAEILARAWDART